MRLLYTYALLRLLRATFGCYTTTLLKTDDDGYRAVSSSVTLSRPPQIFDCSQWCADQPGCDSFQVTSDGCRSIEYSSTYQLLSDEGPIYQLSTQTPMAGKVL